MTTPTFVRTYAGQPDHPRRERIGTLTVLETTDLTYFHPYAADWDVTRVEPQTVELFTNGYYVFADLPGTCHSGGRNYQHDRDHGRPMTHAWRPYAYEVTNVLGYEPTGTVRGFRVDLDAGVLPHPAHLYKRDAPIYRNGVCIYRRDAA